MVLQPLGREYIAKEEKCEFAAASSPAKGRLSDETLPAHCLERYVLGQNSISRTHSRDCRMLTDSPKETIPALNTRQRSRCHQYYFCGLRDIPTSEKQLSVQL